MIELESLGLLEDTMVVLVSDHGEEFLEHGHIGHCRGLWNTVTHVPLIINVPGVAGRRLETAVQNIDIVPTILDYLEIDREGYGFEGRSLRSLIEGGWRTPARLRQADEDTLGGRRTIPPHLQHRKRAILPLRYAHRPPGAARSLRP